MQLAHDSWLIVQIRRESSQCLTPIHGPSSSLSKQKQTCSVKKKKKREVWCAIQSRLPLKQWHSPGLHRAVHAQPEPPVGSQGLSGLSRVPQILLWKTFISKGQAETAFETGSLLFLLSFRFRNVMCSINFCVYVCLCGYTHM